MTTTKVLVVYYRDVKYDTQLPNQTSSDPQHIYFAKQVGYPLMQFISPVMPNS